MAKQIKYSEDARKILKSGLDKRCQRRESYVGAKRAETLFWVLAMEVRQLQMTGVTIAKDIELEDNIENIGAEIIKRSGK